VFHAGTERQKDGDLVTSGGRVLCVTALGAALEESRRSAYAAYDRISFDGKFCRRDIGLRTERRVAISEAEEGAEPVLESGALGPGIARGRAPRAAPDRRQP